MEICSLLNKYVGFHPTHYTRDWFYMELINFCLHIRENIGVFAKVWKCFGLVMIPSIMEVAEAFDV